MALWRNWQTIANWGFLGISAAFEIKKSEGNIKYVFPFTGGDQTWSLVQGVVREPGCCRQGWGWKSSRLFPGRLSIQCKNHPVEAWGCLLNFFPTEQSRELGEVSTPAWPRQLSICPAFGHNHHHQADQQVAITCYPLKIVFIRNLKGHLPDINTLILELGFFICNSCHQVHWKSDSPTKKRHQELCSHISLVTTKAAPVCCPGEIGNRNIWHDNLGNSRITILIYLNKFLRQQNFIF